MKMTLGAFYDFCVLMQEDGAGVLEFKNLPYSERMYLIKAMEERTSETRSETGSQASQARTATRWQYHKGLF